MWWIRFLGPVTSVFLAQSSTNGDGTGGISLVSPLDAAVVAVVLNAAADQEHEHLALLLLSDRVQTLGLSSAEDTAATLKQPIASFTRRRNICTITKVFRGRTS